MLEEIRTCSLVSIYPMFLWISSNSCSLNLLLVRSHQAEIIAIKRFIQERMTKARVRVEPRSCNQNCRKKDVFTLSARLPTILRVWWALSNLIQIIQLRLFASFCMCDCALFVCLFWRRLQPNIWLHLQIFSNVFGCSGFPHWNSALWRYQHNLHFIFHWSTVSPTRGTNRFNELFGPSIYWWFWNYFGFKPFHLNFHAGSNFIGQVIIVFARKNAQAIVYWICNLLNYLINKLWIDSRLVPIEYLSGNSRERKGALFLRPNWSYDLDLTQSLAPLLHSWIRPLRWLSLLNGFEQAPNVLLKKSNPTWKRVNFTISGYGSSKLTAYPCPIYD